MLKILGGQIVGIHSWCFRGLKGGNADVIKALKECGVETVELSGFHIKAAADGKNLDETLSLYSENGINLNAAGEFSIDAEGGRGDNIFAFEFAKKAGLECISASIGTGAAAYAEGLCRRYSVKLAVHNHGKRHAYGKIGQLKDLFSITSPDIGLCLDTGWALDAGEDPAEFIRQFKDRLYGVHLKDFLFNENGEKIDVALGRGLLKTDSIIDALKKIGFKGFLSIEYAGEKDDPIPGVKACVDFLRRYV